MRKNHKLSRQLTYRSAFRTLNRLSEVLKISLEMQNHRNLQRQVILFNRAFAPFLLLSLMHLFSMSLVLLFSIIKLEHEHETTFLVYVGNALLFITRAFITFSSYGYIQCKEYKMWK